MFIRLINVLLLWICCCPVPTFAAVKVPIADCDTLITTGGQVLLVHVVPCRKESVIRFTYCGDDKEKVVEVKRSIIRSIHSAPRQIDGAKLVIPETPAQVAAEKRLIQRWTKVAAIGGFGSVLIYLAALGGSPYLFIGFAVFSIIGLLFGSMVLIRTRHKTNFKKERLLAIWSMVAAWFWFFIIGLLLSTYLWYGDR